MRSGAPGFVGDYGQADAICFAGGSLYWLEAAMGVQAELFAMREYSTRWDSIALVSSAIIMEFGMRDNAIYPDKALGRAALQAARPNTFPLGPRGAGHSASVGKFGPPWEREPACQGAGFRQVEATTIAVFTVANAIGAIIDRKGAVVRGCLDREDATRHSITEGVERKLAGAVAAAPAGGNTTLTLLITNQMLGARSLQQIGKQVHSSMARAIQPFHGSFDGDVLFAATTNATENKMLDDLSLGVLASELAWDAVLASVSV
jgi:L-aminopeptidase/D-esterase-like protein